MKTKAMFASIGVLMASASTSSAVPIEFDGNGHFYDLIAGPVIFWDDARAAALSMGGYLATITDAAENDFLTTLFDTQAWIGGFDAAVEGEWRWADGPEAGSLLTYFNWRPDQGPNNPDVGTRTLEDHLHFLGDQGGTWADSVQGVGLGTFIVEWDSDPTVTPPPPPPPSPVPVPAGLPLLLTGFAGLAGLRLRKGRPARG